MFEASSKGRRVLEPWRAHWDSWRSPKGEFFFLARERQE
jgi:hypothetical protein